MRCQATASQESRADVEALRSFPTLSSARKEGPLRALKLSGRR